MRSSSALTSLRAVEDLLEARRRVRADRELLEDADALLAPRTRADDLLYVDVLEREPGSECSRQSPHVLGTSRPPPLKLDHIPA